MLKEKLLKVVKMMDRFTLEELSIIIEEPEDAVLIELKSLLQQRKLKQLNDTEYLFTGRQKLILKNSSLNSRQKHNEFYYYFRDFYLLYSAETTKIAYTVAKEKYLRENPEIAENDLPDIKFFKKRLHAEFNQSIIDAYRYRGQALKEEFKRKYLDQNPSQKSKRTIKDVPEYFDFSINENLNAIRIVFTCHFNKLLKNKEVKFQKYGKEYCFKLKGHYQHLKYGDLVFDILLACIHLWQIKSNNTNNNVLISVDDIAFLRLQKTFSKGFKIKDKEFYREYLEFLGDIRLSIDNNEDTPLIRLKNRTDFYFTLQIDDYLLEDIEGKLPVSLLKYPIYTRRREKRMGYLLNYLQKTSSASLKFKLKDIFEELGTTIYLKKKGTLERMYLEDLLNALKDKGLIKSWKYEGVTNEIMNRQQWLKEFVNCYLIIEVKI